MADRSVQVTIRGKAPSEWGVGDHVLLSPTGLLRDWTSARVTGITPTGSVEVRLSRPIRGCWTATASPRELLRLPPRRG